MPSVSKNQEEFMKQFAAHNRSFALKVGVPQKVAKEFVSADKSKKRWNKKKV